MISLKEKYEKEVIPLMMEKFSYKNKMAVPRIEKVVVNSGFGRLLTNKSGEEQKKIYEAILEDLSLITGQKPVLRKAKKSVASFKVRKGMPLGAMVTLRGARMYDFLERVINFALPRTRDFRGIDPKSIDRQGNLTYGLREHLVFPEIMPEKVKQIFGLEFTVVTNAKSREEALEFFKLIGFPIKKVN
jgi:large subunit ribosomal protein L5